ncbi:hypothetical protein R5R35_002345 [Gryllus longicercus]|uniref:NADPH-dependent diflavin oxidoreductase 1 n=1 Tax=Gryllus longicercus TaxID=2509291 RepID=A0AAN9Z861_9ORTH
MLEMESRKLKILYGSQTGTSQEVAERFWRDSKRYYFQGPVLALDDYPVTQLIFETLIIFVCSTTGDGKEPDNMKKFWKFLLRKNLPLDSLKGLRFAVLGLGDSSYTKFNYAAKKLYRRLLQLGGVALLDVGLADDQHDLGPDAVIDKWSEQLWKTLGEIFPLPNGTEPLSENNLFSARWTIKILNTESENNDIEVSDIIWIQNCEKHTVSLEENTCLLTVKKNIRTTAESHFQMVPHRYFFKLLSHFTTNELEKEKLEEFVSVEGQQELFNYCNRPRRTILEVLADFPNAAANIPLNYLFELLRPIKPRAFSIASSPKKHEGELHLLVAVVKYKTKLFLPRLGLCSNWLASLNEHCSAPVWVKKGTFRFPSALDTPVIMVGPGTGVAPFRSFIQEKVALNQARADLLYLFFGCRNHDGDFHCRDEWLTLQENEKLTMFCAFSRDQENKVYVQHIMKEQAALLWSLFSSQQASFYLAGRSDNMPAAVKDVLINDVACSCGQLSSEEASQWLARLEACGRYQVETWS